MSKRVVLLSPVVIAAFALANCGGVKNMPWSKHSNTAAAPKPTPNSNPPKATTPPTQPPVATTAPLPAGVLFELNSSGDANADVKKMDAATESCATTLTDQTYQEILGHPYDGTTKDVTVSDADQESLTNWGYDVNISQSFTDQDIGFAVGYSDNERCRFTLGTGMPDGPSDFTVHLDLNGSKCVLPNNTATDDTYFDWELQGAGKLPRFVYDLSFACQVDSIGNYNNCKPVLANIRVMQDQASGAAVPLVLGTSSAVSAYTVNTVQYAQCLADQYGK